MLLAPMKNNENDHENETAWNMHGGASSEDHGPSVMEQGGSSRQG
jgi:hypothetical protein